MITPEITLAILFFFGMTFETIITARSFPAAWAWLETVIRTGVLLAGETYLTYGFLSFDQIFYFIWLPTFLIVGPRLMARIIRQIIGRKLHSTKSVQEIFHNAP